MKMKQIGLAIVAVGLSSAAQAQIVNIDVTPFSGINGGVAANSTQTFSIGPFGDMVIYNSRFGITGLDGDFDIDFGIISSTARANPRNFAAGSMINGTVVWSNVESRSGFKSTVDGATSPDWGAGSYMGFRAQASTSTFYYGWLETTWDSTANQFQILIAWLLGSSRAR